MYQAYVVQKFNGQRMNVILGENFESMEDAIRSANTYMEYFGGERYEIEPAGKPIPTSKPEKFSILDLIVKFCN